MAPTHSIPTELLDTFYGLSSLEPFTRQEAATKLLSFDALKDSSSRQFVYVVKRLTRGLISSNDSSRQGFSMALTTVLMELVRQKKEEQDRDDAGYKKLLQVLRNLLKNIEDLTDQSKNVRQKKSGRKDLLLGKCFGCAVLLKTLKEMIVVQDTEKEAIQSRLLDNITTLSVKVIDALFVGTKEKAWMVEPCYSLIHEYLDAVFDRKQVLEQSDFAYQLSNMFDLHLKNKTKTKGKSDAEATLVLYSTWEYTLAIRLMAVLPQGAMRKTNLHSMVHNLLDNKNSTIGPEGLRQMLLSKGPKWAGMNMKVESSTNLDNSDESSLFNSNDSLYRFWSSLCHYLCQVENREDFEQCYLRLFQLQGLLPDDMENRRLQNLSIEVRLYALLVLVNHLVVLSSSNDESKKLVVAGQDIGTILTIILKPTDMDLFSDRKDMKRPKKMYKAFSFVLSKLLTTTLAPISGDNEQGLHARKDLDLARKLILRLLTLSHCEFDKLSGTGLVRSYLNYTFLGCKAVGVSPVTWFDDFCVELLDGLVQGADENLSKVLRSYLIFMMDSFLVLRASEPGKNSHLVRLVGRICHTQFAVKKRGAAALKGKRSSDLVTWKALSALEKIAFPKKKGLVFGLRDIQLLLSTFVSWLTDWFSVESASLAKAIDKAERSDIFRQTVASTVASLHDNFNLSPWLGVGQFTEGLEEEDVSLLKQIKNSSESTSVSDSLSPVFSLEVVLTAFVVCNRLVKCCSEGDALEDEEEMEESTLRNVLEVVRDLDTVRGELAERLSAARTAGKDSGTEEEQAESLSSVDAMSQASSKDELLILMDCYLAILAQLPQFSPVVYCCFISLIQCHGSSVAGQLVGMVDLVVEVLVVKRPLSAMENAEDDGADEDEQAVEDSERDEASVEEENDDAEKEDLLQDEDLKEAEQVADALQDKDFLNDLEVESDGEMQEYETKLNDYIGLLLKGGKKQKTADAKALRENHDFKVRVMQLLSFFVRMLVNLPELREHRSLQEFLVKIPLVLLHMMQSCLNSKGKFAYDQASVLHDRASEVLKYLLGSRAKFVIPKKLSFQSGFAMDAVLQGIEPEGRNNASTENGDQRTQLVTGRKAVLSSVITMTLRISLEGGAKIAQFATNYVDVLSFYLKNGMTDFSDMPALALQSDALAKILPALKPWYTGLVTKGKCNLALQSFERFLTKQEALAWLFVVDLLDALKDVFSSSQETADTVHKTKVLDCFKVLASRMQTVLSPVLRTETQQADLEKLELALCETTLEVLKQSRLFTVPNETASQNGEQKETSEVEKSDKKQNGLDLSQNECRTILKPSFVFVTTVAKEIPAYPFSVLSKLFRELGDYVLQDRVHNVALLETIISSAEVVSPSLRQELTVFRSNKRQSAAAKKQSRKRKLSTTKAP